MSTGVWSPPPPAGPAGDLEPTEPLLRPASRRVADPGCDPRPARAAVRPGAVPAVPGPPDAASAEPAAVLSTGPPPAARTTSSCGCREPQAVRARAAATTR